MIWFFFCFFLLRFQLGMNTLKFVLVSVNPIDSSMICFNDGQLMSNELKMNLVKENERSLSIWIISEMINNLFIIVVIN